MSTPFAQWLRSPGAQHVIRNDTTMLTEPAAYTIDEPTYRQTGIYSGISTVEEHVDLVEEFTDETVFDGTFE